METDTELEMRTEVSNSKATETVKSSRYFQDINGHTAVDINQTIHNMWFLLNIHTVY